jgi:hypothetical protein
VGLAFAALSAAVSKGCILQKISQTRVVWLCERTMLVRGSYWPIELATEENTLFELEPIKRIVPTTNTRITANITAYSAMSWPRSSVHKFRKVLAIIPLSLLSQ